MPQLPKLLAYIFGVYLKSVERLTTFPLVYFNQLFVYLLSFFDCSYIFAFVHLWDSWFNKYIFAPQLLLPLHVPKFSGLQDYKHVNRCDLESVIWNLESRPSDLLPVILSNNSELTRERERVSAGSIQIFQAIINALVPRLLVSC